MPIRRLLLASVLALILPAVACYHAMPGSPGASLDRTILTRAEVNSERFGSAYDAIAGLRANWLREPGTTSFAYQTELQVYSDGVRIGNKAALKDIPANIVESIKFYNGMEASSRWGLDHGRGAIYVITTGRLRRP